MKIPSFEDWLEHEMKVDPPPPARETYRIERWVLWVAVAVLVAATIASGAHNVPTIMSTLPPLWPEWLRWAVALAGFIAFDVGLFLSAYFLFFFQYRHRSQEKLNEYKIALENDPDTATLSNPVDNRWVLAVGAGLTIVYTVIANIHAAGVELLAGVPAWMDTVTVVGMGVIPLWAFFAGEYVARIRAFNSVAVDLDDAVNKASYRVWHKAKGKRYERLVKKAEQVGVQSVQPERSNEQTVNTGGSLNATLNPNERVALFKRAWDEQPERFDGMSVRDIAQEWGVSIGTVSNVRNGK